jgi:hypothetical protein
MSRFIKPNASLNCRRKQYTGVQKLRFCFSETQRLGRWYVPHLMQ